MEKLISIELRNYIEKNNALNLIKWLSDFDIIQYMNEDLNEENPARALKVYASDIDKYSNLNDIIKSKDRKKAGLKAPACGLYLNNVYYNKHN